jgi:hypothetical protein
VVQEFESSQFVGGPGSQAPALQRSPSEQAFPSSQGAVFGVAVHPIAGSHASSVQTFVSSQTSGAPGVQAPEAQRSPSVQAFASSQGAVFGVLVQPTKSTQESSVQTFASLHWRRTPPPAQIPSEHWSTVVQGFVSSQGVPFGMGAWMHPVRAPQTSAVQVFVSLQFLGPPGAQEPAWQLSPSVQRFPSSQVVPFATGAFTHPVAGSQESPVQTFESLQFRGFPGMQRPLTQVSPTVQALASSQRKPSGKGAWLQPEALLQVSTVQEFVSSQFVGPAGVQAPNWQVSPAVQASPSVQGRPWFVGWATQAFPVSSQMPTLHWSVRAEQSVRAPPPQTPAAQVSPVVQKSPSLQTEPSGRVMGWQASVPSLQAPIVQPALRAEQSKGDPPPQTPDSQDSPVVQNWPSLQGLPSLMGSAMQVLSTSSQIPSLHWSSSMEQSRGPPLLHVPREQVSPTVQKEPSSQGEPSGTSVWKHPVWSLQRSFVQSLESLQLRATPTHVPVRQVSKRVQTLWSLHGPPSFVGTGSQLFVLSLHTARLQSFAAEEQFVGPPLPQAPAVQNSPLVQKSPSSQGSPFAAAALCTHPVAGLQESAVQAFPSLQTMAEAGVQLPAWHVSPVVQASPSLQTAPLSGVGLLTQASVVSLQESAVHWFASSQRLGLPPPQAPAEQVSPRVQN